MPSTLLLRPGIMVSLHTEVHDTGLSYARKILSTTATVEKTEVTRTLLDAAEHDRATKARGAARYAIESVCNATPFGLLCTEDKREYLDAAIEQAYKLADRHRRGYVDDEGNIIPPAKYTSVQVDILCGTIASTDEQAANSVARKLRELLATINDGVDRLDAKTIREAADKAKELSGVLTPEAEATVSEAIKAARTAARTIVRRIEKNGEQAAQVLVEIDRRAINEARIRFLDTSEDAPDAEPGEALPSVAVQRFADLGEDESDEPELTAEAFAREKNRDAAWEGRELPYPEADEPTANEVRDLAQDAIERDAASA